MPIAPKPHPCLVAADPDIGTKSITPPPMWRWSIGRLRCETYKLCEIERDVGNRQKGTLVPLRHASPWRSAAKLLTKERAGRTAAAVLPAHLGLERPWKLNSGRQFWFRVKRERRTRRNIEMSR